MLPAVTESYVLRRLLCTVVPLLGLITRGAEPLTCWANRTSRFGVTSNRLIRFGFAIYVGLVIRVTIAKLRSMSPGFLRMRLSPIIGRPLQIVATIFLIEVQLLQVAIVV